MAASGIAENNGMVNWLSPKTIDGLDHHRMGIGIFSPFWQNPDWSVLLDFIITFNTDFTYFSLRPRSGAFSLLIVIMNGFHTNLLVIYVITYEIYYEN